MRYRWGRPHAIRPSDSGKLSRASVCSGIDIPVLDERFLVDQAWTAEEQHSLRAWIPAGLSSTSFVGEASISGSLFELPAGDVEAVFGVSFRRDEIDDQPGPNTVASNLHLFSSAGRTFGSENVRELFAEIGLPLLADKPGADNVTAVLSGRLHGLRYLGR